MTPFSTDADLLAYEPRVLHELPFAGQTRLRVTDAQVDGVVITSSSGGFAALAVGQVVLLGEGAFAIAAVEDDNTLTVGNPIVGIDDTTLTVRTLEPQRLIVHAELMRSIGLDRDDPDVRHDESAVLNVDQMRQIETLGTLARAYAGAVTVGDAQMAQDKAERYRGRFARALLSGMALLDLDGDARADAVRHMGVGRLVRS